MDITLNRSDRASRLSGVHVHDGIHAEPFASFEALARSLRAAAREQPSLWLRCAAVGLTARKAGACDALITAALLHRLGNLASAMRVDRTPRALSPAESSHLGADLLVDLHPPLVTETIRMHPSALRYLGTIGPTGVRRLPVAEFVRSRPATIPMSEPERACFAALPLAMNAVRLARWTLAASEEPPDKASVERELPALYRIAERSVCNDGFGWGG